MGQPHTSSKAATQVGVEGSSWISRRGSSSWAVGGRNHHQQQLSPPGSRTPNRQDEGGNPGDRGRVYIDRHPDPKGPPDL